MTFSSSQSASDHLRSKPRLLNVGCGDVFHPGWTNLDINPIAEEVVQCDIRKGLPFESGIFHAVYHSHVLEHLCLKDAERLIDECSRVLLPGGTLRVVVPDLESICRLYLQKLEALLDGDESSVADYDWMTLELYDQAVRTRSGGGMVDFIRSAQFRNQNFVRSRIGNSLVDSISASSQQVNLPSDRTALVRKLYRRARSLRSGVRSLVRTVAFGAGGQSSIEEVMFRRQGEIHRWMYDRYSLPRLLRRTGLVDARVVDAHSSAIPLFSVSKLDVMQGEVRKPDSLFVEATKPALEGA